MHQPIPERSMSCPISSSSGTRIASCSRDRLAYLLVIETAPRVHVQRGVHVRLLVFTAALLRGLLALARHFGDDPVQLRPQREAQIMGEENCHLLELVLGEFAVVHRGVDLNL